MNKATTIAVVAAGAVAVTGISAAAGPDLAAALRPTSGAPSLTAAGQPGAPWVAARPATAPPTTGTAPEADRIAPVPAVPGPAVPIPTGPDPAVQALTDFLTAGALTVPGEESSGPFTLPAHISTTPPTAAVSLYATPPATTLPTPSATEASTTTPSPTPAEPSRPTRPTIRVPELPLMALDHPSIDRKTIGLGPDGIQAGPSHAPACTGVPITPTDKAADVVDNHPAGTTFCFTAGLHRISRTIQPKNGDVLGSDQGAVLTGSIQLTDWTPAGDDWMVKGVLPPAYPRTGQCEDNVANICYLREQVFLEGKHLRRVASREKVVPGTFYGDYANDVVYLGDDPTGKTVEMSSTPTAIESAATNVTVRGLTVEHFATPPQGGAVVLGPGWKVFANDIRWNHAVGAMLVNADGAVLEKNLIHHNGQLGVGQYSTVNGTITGNEVSHNNTDGFWIADWESGGIKTTWSTGGVVSANLIKANKGIGLWSDAYDDSRTFANNEIVDNAADGIRFEISRKGVIENNLVTGNGLGTGRGSGTSLWDGGGINVNTSSTVRVRNNRVADNMNGISIQSRTRGNGPWGLNLLRDVVVSGNTVTMKKGTAATGMVQNSGAAVPSGTVTLRENTYVLDSLTTDRFQKFGEWFTAHEWPHSGQDINSKFTTR